MEEELMWLSCDFNKSPSLFFSWNAIFTWKNNWQITIIQMQGFVKQLLKKQRSESIASRKKSWQSLWPMIKLKQKIGILYDGH